MEIIFYFLKYIVKKKFIKCYEYIFIIKWRKNKMPNKDGTGPNGNGPRTGRQNGNCSGNTENDFPIRGKCMGRGFGRRNCKRRTTE